MSAPIVLVSGDFVLTGGMDRANHALASYLLDRGREVHFVSHRVDPALLARPGAVFHRVAKPLNSYLLGEPLLNRAGRRWARRLASRGARVVVNGGNCNWGDINWVHYVHAAWRPPLSGTGIRRLKNAYARRALRVEERASLSNARVVIANSERTRTDLITRLNVPADRVHTVYYGVDADRFRPPTPAARAEARAGSAGTTIAPRPCSWARWETLARESIRCWPRGAACPPIPPGTRGWRSSARERRCRAGSRRPKRANSAVPSSSSAFEATFR